MPRRNQNILNRGRFQAQGDGIEKSRSWSEIKIPTKLDGRSYINDLKTLLHPAALCIRKTCFEKAMKWVNAAPSIGYVVDRPVKTSFPLIPPQKGIRVDAELYSGIAFKDYGE